MYSNCWNVCDEEIETQKSFKIRAHKTFCRNIVWNSANLPNYSTFHIQPLFETRNRNENKLSDGNCLCIEIGMEFWWLWIYAEINRCFKQVVFISAFRLTQVDPNLIEVNIICSRIDKNEDLLKIQWLNFMANFSIIHFSFDPIPIVAYFNRISIIKFSKFAVVWSKLLCKKLNPNVISVI